jgi:hypothetical protein
MRGGSKPSRIRDLRLVLLKRDDLRMNHHRASAHCLRMIPRVKPEGMLFGKPFHTFPDHSLKAQLETIERELAA